LIFYTGIRTFAARPVFSQHRSGTKQKFERFFQPGDISVASCIAPITFPPMPLLVFKYVGVHVQLMFVTGLRHVVACQLYDSWHFCSPAWLIFLYLPHHHS
jgi:hypothetical protein